MRLLWKASCHTARLPVLRRQRDGGWGRKFAWILFRGRSASWPFHGRQERTVLIVLPGNESLRCSLWLNTPQLNSTPSSLAPLHSWPEGKINLVTKLNKEMLQVLHFTIALRVRELTEAPASRCQGQTAGLRGKCRNISAECCNHPKLQLWQERNISIYYLCSRKTTLLNRLAFGRHGHMRDSPSTLIHLSKIRCQKIGDFVTVWHLTEIFTFSLLKGLSKSFSFGRSLLWGGYL